VIGILVAAAALGLASHDEVKTDHTWTCRQKVDLDLVQVTIPAGERQDAVHLRYGCTGRIGKLVVVQRSGDGVKVAEGVHDLVVGGGSVRCLAKAPRFHQDGIQVMGGARITFHDLKVSCGRRNERLINAKVKDPLDLEHGELAIAAGLNDRWLEIRALDACAQHVVPRGAASGFEAFDLLEALVRELEVPDLDLVEPVAQERQEVGALHVHGYAGSRFRLIIPG